ncbi:hypothetical protein [Streptomyces sp. NPDC054837]
MTADLVDWSSIAASDFCYPEAVPASRLVEELSAMLVSSDPKVRDDYAYTAAARWIREGRLDAVLEVLGDRATTWFTHAEIQHDLARNPGRSCPGGIASLGCFDPRGRMGLRC